ncbi:MAG TPA: NosD domain-containing protein [Patescibacteria group bacterium]|nr:NosD domain-containing protein [Patescibacteria group bacterium]
MRKGVIYLGFIILSVIIFSSLTSAVTRTCSSCNNCTAEIGNASSGDIVQLTQSISGISGTCINFNVKSNITFDCQSYQIIGDNSAFHYGISMTNSKGNNIGNCSIYDFYTGIYTTSSNNNSFTDIISTSNTQDGLDIEFGNNNNFTNTISNFNAYNGIYLFGSNNNIINNLTASFVTQQYGVYLSSSNNNIFSNIIANSAYFYYGIYISSSSNNTLTNLTTNSNIYGIVIAGNNNTLTNITSNSNQDGGVWIPGLSYNNTLTNLSLKDNQEYDISIESCSNTVQNINGSGNRSIEFYNSSAIIQNKDLAELILCGANNSVVNNVTIRGSPSLKNNWLYVLNSNNISISNINSSYNYDGIYATGSSNLNLVNITVNNNAFEGIGVQATINSTFSNIISKNNLYYGIYFFLSSNYNTITNSFIQYNSRYGVYLQSSGSNSPQYNLFYNNYFNNSAQYYNTTNITNFFNTTKTPGTNIVGGAYLGGNYWAALNGTGFSQICISSTDGICDTAYSLDGINYDFLPLTCTESWSCGDWQTCQPSGTQTRTCTDANFCQTYKYMPAISQSCAYSGGGLQNQNSVETNTGTIISGQPSTISITNSNISLLNITVNTNTNISDAKIKISNTGISNFLVGVPFGVFYQAFYINTTLKNENLNNVTLEFRVNQTWLIQQNRSYNDVLLYRIPNSSSSWQALTTISVRNDSKYYYFSALSPGFSTFVILAGQPGTIKCTLLEKRCFNNQIQSCDGNGNWETVKQCPGSCENSQCVQTFLGIKVSLIYYGGIMIVGVIIILILLSMFRKFRKNKKH